MTINEVLKNLNGMQVDEDLQQFKEDIVIAFGDYEFKGVTEVIVAEDRSNPNIDYQAYINHEEAPIICIKIEKK